MNNKNLKFDFDSVKHAETKLKELGYEAETRECCPGQNLPFYQVIVQDVGDVIDLERFIEEEFGVSHVVLSEDIVIFEEEGVA